MTSNRYDMAKRRRLKSVIHTAALALACAISSLALAGDGGGNVAEHARGITTAPAPTGHRISGYAWIDADQDNALSIWEQKLPKAAVRLLRGNTVIRSAVTDSSGNYAIDNIPPGSYRISLAPRQGYSVPIPAPLTLTADSLKNLALAQPRSIEEAALNRFGDPWSTARHNPSLPLVAATGCYRVPAPGMGPRFKAEELQFFNRLGANFYFEGCAEMLETRPAESDLPSKLKARVAQLKAADRTREFLTYTQLVYWESERIGATHILRNRRDWFLYKRDATTQSNDDIVKAPNGALMLDITNPGYQDYMAGRLAQSLTEYNIDGILFDLMYPLPSLADIAEIDPAKVAKWENGIRSFLKKLKIRIGPSRYVFVNTPQRLREYSLTLVPVVDGIMLEDTFSPLSASGAIERRQQIIDAAAARGKWIFTTVNTFVDKSTFESTSPAREHTLNRYYLSAFYMFQKGKMLFYSSPPTATLPQYGAQAFFADWNINVGAPRGPSKPLAHLVFQRNYANSVVFLNDNGRKAFTVTAPAGFDLDPEGKKVTTYRLPPKTGIILSSPRAFK